MKLLSSVEEIKQTAIAMLAQVDALEKLTVLDLPGQFVFSPPDNSRLVISSIAELHHARIVLRKTFGWRDKIRNKFFSSGVVIVTYSPNDDVKLPIPFDLWIESPPESFPNEILGDCKIVEHDRKDYSIVCNL